mmetsp:Transcript_23020/g.67912  ORF Transcript_23020/g.67912 Transcript_23020/m.67912 type:complete len:214 (-) Transcript_23020:493-1134(-)
MPHPLQSLSCPRVSIVVVVVVSVVVLILVIGNPRVRFAAGLDGPRREGQAPGHRLGDRLDREGGSGRTVLGDPGVHAVVIAHRRAALLPHAQTRHPRVDGEIPHDAGRTQRRGRSDPSVEGTRRQGRDGRHGRVPHVVGHRIVVVLIVVQSGERAAVRQKERSDRFEGPGGDSSASASASSISSSSAAATSLGQTLGGAPQARQGPYLGRHGR